MSLNSITLKPTIFNDTHMFVTLAIVESLLNEEGYGFAYGVTLDTMNTRQLKEVFVEYVKSVNLEVCCDKL